MIDYIFSVIFLIKAFAAVSFVLLLTIISEKISPKTAGIVSGLPTGTAINLFFFGLENGASFASKSAVFNLVGIAAFQVFIFVYYLASRKLTKFNIILSAIAAITAYFIVNLIMFFFNFNILTAILVPIISIPIFTFLLKKIPDTKIKKRVKLSLKILFPRALCATSIILFITSIAKFIGIKWAGVLSVFPTTVLPLLLIVHYTYGVKNVHTIIKNIPTGLWAVMIYSICVFLFYPKLGIFLGTVMACLFVVLFLMIYFAFNKKNRKKIES